MKYAKILHGEMLPYYKEYKALSAEERKEAKTKLLDDAEALISDLRSKFAEEITGEFVFKEDEADENIITMLKCSQLRIFDMVTMYRSTCNISNKILIAAKLQEYTSNNKKKIDAFDTGIAAIVLAEIEAHNPEAVLKNFEITAEKYIELITNDKLIDDLTDWAQSFGLEM